MENNNGESCDGVRLIDASDSLKAVTLGENSAFMPSKLSRLPIRVIKPPQPTSSSALSLMQHGQKSPSKNRELLRYAEQQRKLIDSYQREIEDREVRGPHSEHQRSIQLSSLRREVVREENEMTRLHILQRETNEACAERIIVENKLRKLQNEVSSQGQQLRIAFSKIDSLKAQLELLYRRRLSAMNAAIRQQRLVSPECKNQECAISQKTQHHYPQTNEVLNAAQSDNRSVQSSVGTALSAAINSVESKNAINFVMQNFNHLYGSLSTETNDKICMDNSSAPVFDALNHSKSQPNRDRMTSSILSDTANRPRASVEPFQVNSNVLPSSKLKMVENVPKKIESPRPVDLDNLINNLNENRIDISLKQNRNESPSPPGDPFPTYVNENCTEDKPSIGLVNDLVNNTSKDNINHEIANTHEKNEICNSSRRLATIYHLWDEAKILDHEPPPADLLGNGDFIRDEISKLANADQVSIRPGTLRAAKRRSWVQQETSQDETDYIRKILCEEQKKGRTHIILDPYIENILSMSANQNSLVENAGNISNVGAKRLQLDDSNLYESSNAPSNVTKENDSENLLEDQRLDNDEQKFVNSGDKNEEELDKIIISGADYSESLELTKEISKDSILRSVNSKKLHKKVVFDPLALLLDACLEGEIDLVKECAIKMSNLSACNDEGITALHNAICAGHYEIVRYLIESHADVNAQDSDGWTPLHCAASCNNLPMVKMLVENGACIFAQTLSDLETPIEKCEEEEEGFEGCQRYLNSALNGAGTINEQQMYAAYGYEEQQDDELSFPAGAILKVLQKEVDGKGWWFCEYEDRNVGKRQGLVPRNFLSLYPSLVHRNPTFVPFDLPDSFSLTEVKVAGPNDEGKSFNRLFADH